MLRVESSRRMREYTERREGEREEEEEELKQIA